jgi:Domain of unknown function (DUF5664)
LSEDFKIKTAETKPRLSLIPQGALVGAARVFGYGARKYAKGNFLNATVADGAIERYCNAFLRHLAASQHANGEVVVTTLDDESGLPHLDHMICGLLMLRAILVKDGVLSEDPGIGNNPPKGNI